MTARATSAIDDVVVASRADEDDLTEVCARGGTREGSVAQSLKNAGEYKTRRRRFSPYENEFHPIPRIGWAEIRPKNLGFRSHSRPREAESGHDGIRREAWVGLNGMEKMAGERNGDEVGEHLLKALSCVPEGESNRRYGRRRGGEDAR
ncbi:hypothetical protein K438DRAFT_1774192 [Mycena galopus ATCC 62051]|nr:hypothetical protein K438DRAFT_1774192 [Mycena galopus ATCC 62051]